MKSDVIFLRRERPLAIKSRNLPFDMTEAELARLRCNKWLNDKILNYFISILNSEEFLKISSKHFPRRLKSSKYHIFNTFFCLNIIALEEAYFRSFSNDKDIVEIKPTIEFKSKKIEIFNKIKYVYEQKYTDVASYGTIFLPFIRENHWSLVIINDFKKFYYEIKTIFLIIRKYPHLSFDMVSIVNKLHIFHLDSINSSSIFGYVQFKMVAEVLNLIIIGLLQIEVDMSLSPLVEIISSNNCFFQSVSVPYQRNNYDCGICLLENIEQNILTNLAMIHPCHLQNESFYPIEVCQWKRLQILKLIEENLSGEQLIVC